MLTHNDLILIGIAAVVLLGGCLFEAWHDSRPSSGASRRRTWLALGLAIALLIFAVLGARYAHARDVDGRYVNSPLKPWFDALRSKGGGPCCSDADGTALSDVDWDTRDGHYRVRLEGEWIDVPDDRVITEPNRAGRTMVWPFYLMGRPEIRCFMPGSMT